MHRLVTALLTLVLVCSAVTSGYLAWGFHKRATTPARVAAQVNHLHDALDHGAGAQMQALFPEGEMFTAELTGLAAANLARQDGARRAWALAEVNRALAVVESERVTRQFSSMAFEHGIFWRGWRLLLLADRAELSGQTADVTAARKEARAVLTALEQSPTGLVESYPGQTWPCDNVVAMAAVHRVLRATPEDGLRASTARWMAKLDRIRDADHGGLLPHRVDATGRPSESPRGTSQSIIVSFWPDIDERSAYDQWIAFRDVFLTRQAGLLGVREYPAGVAKGAGDVDSGPLVLGVSLSASATALAAARRMGDGPVARGLDSEAEVFGLPTGGEKANDRRRFALGLMPVGDAFVAWARSHELGPNPDNRTSEEARRDAQLAPLTWAWIGGAAVPGLLCLGLLVAGRRRR